MKLEKPKVIVIVGPTAVGKTAISIQLAKQFNGEIINGDSLQVYRGLDIGTAKAAPVEREGIPHHLLDIKDPAEPFTASDFKHAAQATIQDISQRGKLPIIVGGSGLYVEGLLRNMEFGRQGEDPAYRRQLEMEAEETGGLRMWRTLAEIDPLAAEAIHPNNTRRVIRALESIHVSGKLFSSQGSQPDSPYTYLILGLDSKRERLYERINLRVDLMAGAGLMEEAKQLLALPGAEHLQSAKGIGYKEWFPYFKGESTWEQTLEDIKRNSRRYAKRQLTWFRNRMPEIKWFNVENEGHYRSIVEEVQRFLNEPAIIKENGYGE